MKNNRTQDQEGSAMVISLLVLLVLTMLGTLMLAQSNIETRIAGHDMRATQALFAAEAGYAEGLARMSDSNDTTNYVGRPNGDWTTNPGWGTYIVMNAGDSAEDPDRDLTLTDGLDNDLDGQVDESGEYYPEVISAQGADAIEYPWVKIQYKMNSTGQVILYGDHDNDMSTPPRQNLTTGVPIIRVASSGERGSASRTVEIEAVKVPFQYVNAAIYSEDDDFKFNGTQFLISGEDYDPATGGVVPSSSSVPGIATTADPNNITAALKNQQLNNVPGDGGSPSVHSSPMDLDLPGLAQQLSSLAEIVVPGGTYSNVTWGDYDNYTIVHCTGDLHVSGQLSGAGILIVDGDFRCTGQMIWYGLELVLGDITFSGGGAGTHIYGSVMVQGGVTQQVVGGNADILFSSAALARLASLSPYAMISWHEL